MDDDATRAVFFDLDGTLVEFADDYGEVLLDATEVHLGVRDDGFAETYSERFLELLGEQASEPYRRGFAHALAEHGHDDAGVDATALADTLREREMAATRPPDGVEAALSTLRERGYRLGVLTNGVPDWQRAKLAAHGLDSLVDAVVVSYEAGAHKPDERAFGLAAERLPADEYAMVGDAHEADVEGARAMGWRGIHYAPAGDAPDDETAVVETFDELVARLD